MLAFNKGFDKCPDEEESMADDGNGPSGPTIAMARRGQLVENKCLALGVTKTGVERTRRIVEAFGPVVPLVVAPVEGQEMFKILSGQSAAEAMKGIETKSIPVVIAGTSGTKEEMILALHLMMHSNEPVAIAQGVLIDRLVKDFGCSPRSLSLKLKISASWLSKRQSLARSLSDDVKTLVTGGVLAPRSAEEVSKLPGPVQLGFARKAIEDGMPKDMIARLVALHNAPETSPELRELILTDPSGVDLAKPIKTRKARRKPGGLEALNSLLRFTAKASHSAVHRLEELDWSREEGLPDRRLIKELFEASRNLAAVTKKILEIMEERRGGDFPRGNAEGGGGE